MSIEMNLKLNTASGKTINKKITNEIIKNHFNDPKNCTKEIIQQINDEHLYNWFDGKKDLTILDCGANIGLFTLHVSDVAKQIVAVEPTPSHISIFNELTSDLKNVKLIEAALAQNDGEISFYFDPNNSTCNSILFLPNHSHRLSVKAKKLKTILDENNLDVVDFAKIDIEGSEIFALTKETIEETEKRIKTWFIETHDSTLMPRQALSYQFADMFNSLGYSNIKIFGQYNDQILIEG